MRLSPAEARELGIPVPKGKRVAKVDHVPAVHSLCRILNIPLPGTEYRFARPRRWKFDFFWPAVVTAGHGDVALEIEGGVWTGGAHVRGKHYESDCLKYNEAALRGWKVLRVTPEMLNDGRALDLLGRAFGRVV